ncbi:hypothetical protein HD554DRAFT_2015691 [Boletus coccyginus]|nr:hypothetical protein HD554DRAFT_2015691 [Boletus coccyginus]
MIHVKWGRDVLHFPIPPLNTPLGELRADLATYTHLPAGSFKLVYKGAVMKDDAAPLSTYKLKEGATIALIGGHSLAPETTSASASHTRPRRKRKQGTISAIKAELDRVRASLVPDVDAFVRALAPSGSDPTSESHAPTPVDHTRLSELLLQSLLRLDALHVSGADWPEARVQRKAAVREVQGVLDRLDGAWAAR